MFGKLGLPALGLAGIGWASTLSLWSMDTRIPMLVGTIAYWGISFPVAYFLGMQLKLGVIGLWWGSAVGLAIAAVLLTWRFSKVASHLCGSLASPSAIE